GGGARRRLPTGPDAGPLAQGIEDLLPGATGVEPLEVVVDGLPGGEVVGQGAPGAALAGAVEQGVDDPTHVGRAGTTARPGRRNQGFEDGPLGVGEVARVGFGCRLAFHTLFYAPHPLLEQSLSTSSVSGK